MSSATQRLKPSKPTGNASGSSSAASKSSREASRHLPPELKARHPHIPWQKVAGIGNVLRHNYENIAAAVMWKLAHDDLDALEAACRTEFEAIKGRGT